MKQTLEEKLEELINEGEVEALDLLLRLKKMKKEVKDLSPFLDVT